MRKIICDICEKVIAKRETVYCAAVMGRKNGKLTYLSETHYCAKCVKPLEKCMKLDFSICPWRD